jgi:hypothetical protein
VHAFLELAVHQIVIVTPTSQPVQVARIIADRFHDNPLLLTSGRTRDQITNQIVRLVKRLKQGLGPTPVIKRMTYHFDMWDFIQQHRLNYERLSDINWESRPRRGKNEIRAMAKTLQKFGVLCGLGTCENAPVQHLIVLDCDEVQNDDRWQFLSRPSESQHKTGPDQGEEHLCSPALLCWVMLCGAMI